MPKPDHDVQHKRYPPEILSHAQVPRSRRLRPRHSRRRAQPAAHRRVYRAGSRISEALGCDPKTSTSNDAAYACCTARRTVAHGRHGPQGLRACRSVDERQISDRRDRPALADLLQPTRRSISAGYCRRLLAGLGQQANIAARVHPHGLRHTHARNPRRRRRDRDHLETTRA